MSRYSERPIYSGDHITMAREVNYFSGRTVSGCSLRMAREDDGLEVLIPGVIDSSYAVAEFSSNLLRIDGASELDFSRLSGQFDLATAYTAGAIVIESGKYYQAALDTTGAKPAGSPDTWTPLPFTVDDASGSWAWRLVQYDDQDGEATLKAGVIRIRGLVNDAAIIVKKIDEAIKVRAAGQLYRIVQPDGTESEHDDINKVLVLRNHYTRIAQAWRDRQGSNETQAGLRHVSVRYFDR